MPKSTVYRVQLEDHPELSEEQIRGKIIDQLVPGEPHSKLQEICLFPSCYSPTDEIVALIKFNDTPQFLARLKSDSGRPLAVLLQGNVRARFDLKFDGFTPLNQPDDAQGIIAEYVDGSD
jgi:hypothetical protein